MPVSRGFSGRRRPEADQGRVPPGQHVVTDFPVLSAGPTPYTPLSEWTIEIRGAVDEPVSWSWEELLALPSETPTVHSDEPGFWEAYGYHMYGDPWREQRYRGD